MFQKKIFLFSLLLTKTFVAAELLEPVYVTPTVEVPVYAQSYTYQREIPTTLITRFSYHKDFANLYLLDQSVWRVKDPLAIAEIQNWNYTDPIVLRAKSWGSDYFLYNVARDTEVRASFSCAPSTSSKYSLYVHSIPLYDNILTLSENGVFHFIAIDHQCMYKIEKWALHDQIIIAWNKDPNAWDMNNPFTLINTRTGDHVDGECVIYQ